jgi:hypothetical protein
MLKIVGSVSVSVSSKFGKRSVWALSVKSSAGHHILDVEVFDI